MHERVSTLVAMLFIMVCMAAGIGFSLVVCSAGQEPAPAKTKAGTLDIETVRSLRLQGDTGQPATLIQGGPHAGMWIMSEAGQGCSAYYDSQTKSGVLAVNGKNDETKNGGSSFAVALVDGKPYIQFRMKNGGLGFMDVEEIYTLVIANRPGGPQPMKQPPKVKGCN